MLVKSNDEYITECGNHRAQICELIGLNMLKRLKNILKNWKIDLYKDDGLIALQKKLCSVDI